MVTVAGRDVEFEQNVCFIQKKELLLETNLGRARLAKNYPKLFGQFWQTFLFWFSLER